MNSGVFRVFTDRNCFLENRLSSKTPTPKRTFAFVRLKHFNLDPGAQIFLACSDVSRLRILNLIFNNEEMCITDLERILDFTQTKTSRHLIYLKNSGILSFRKHNQWAFYFIKDEVYDIVKQILQFLSRDPILQKDQSVFNTMLSNRELALNKLKLKSYPLRA